MRNAITYFFIAISLAAMVVGCVGCYTPYKMHKQVSKAYHKYPLEFTATVSKWFQIQETYFDSVVIKKSDTLWRTDSVTVDCDSAVKAAKSDSSKLRRQTKVKVPCPPCPLTVDTVLHFQRIVKESTLKLKAERLKAENLAAEKAATEAMLAAKQKALDIALWAAIILGVYTLLRWILKLTTRIGLP